MKFILLSLLSLLVSTTVIDTFNQDPTFLDSIYGPLVDNSESQSYKKDLLNLGKLILQSNIEGEDDEFKLEDIDFDNFANLQSKLSALNKHHQSIKSHKSYIKYQTKLTLPPDDNTEDISNIHSMFGGIVTFGGFKHFNCFDPKLYDKPIDIAIVGAPFDTGVSYRPGARFGPESIRSGGRRLGGASVVRNNGFKNSNLTHINPYDSKTHNLSIIDCGDVPLTPFDNRIALNQLYRGERAIHNHTNSKNHGPSKIITMGGDHTITLMTLKSAYEIYGPLNVIHFDSHIDTWDPKVLGGGVSDYMKLNHGTFLHYAAEQGYLNSSLCYHVGMRAPYINDEYDSKHDKDCGFKVINARDIDHLNIRGVVNKLLSDLGTEAPVYISVDIDVLDPAFAPGTGTMEVGGWSTRELISVLDGLEGINLIGGDVVEVSPPFDTNSEITSLAATSVIDSLLGLMIVKELF